MVTKGIIKGRTPDLSVFKYDVEIYIFKAAGDKNARSSGVVQAIAAYTPGGFCGYKTGDCVIVSFEDNEWENPVIIGKLLIPGDTMFDAYDEISKLKEEIKNVKKYMSDLSAIINNVGKM